MALAKSTFSFSIKINKEIGVHKKKDKRTINRIRINNQISMKKINNTSTYTIVYEVISNEECQLGNNCGNASFFMCCKLIKQNSQEDHYNNVNSRACSTRF